MAKDTTSPSRVGQINRGDVDALFFKKFSGEILQTFEESNVSFTLQQSKTVSLLSSR